MMQQQAIVQEKITAQHRKIARKGRKSVIKHK
jgi:hypothetical protein